MFTTWVLDLVVKDAQFDLFEEFSSPLWFVIHADGLPNQFSTPQASNSPKPVWNFATRLIIQLSNIQGAYLYVTLCTYDKNGRDVIAIARSRIRLKSLPVGSPKQFRFPLMNASNSAQIAMNLSVIATLSSIGTKRPPFSAPPNGPSPSSSNIGPSAFNSQ